VRAPSKMKSQAQSSRPALPSSVSCRESQSDVQWESEKETTHYRQGEETTKGVTNLGAECPFAFRSVLLPPLAILPHSPRQPSLFTTRQIVSTHLHCISRLHPRRPVTARVHVLGDVARYGPIRRVASNLAI
jgi:hypothetical protein